MLSVIEFIKLVAKSDKLLDKPRILSLFPNSFNNSIKKRALSIYSIYDVSIDHVCLLRKETSKWL